MATIKLRNGTTVTVPDAVAADYASRGRVDHPAPVSAEHGLDTMTIPQLRDHAETHGIDLGTAKLKSDIRAAIDQAEQSS